MLNRLKLISLITFTSVFINLTAIAASQPSNGHDHGHGMQLKLGRYVGQLVVDAKNKSILASLDLFIVQKDGDYPKLNAILKTYLGSFNSYEYTSNFYDVVLFDPDTKELTLEFQNQDVILSKLKFHGEHLMGKFQSQNSLETGNVHLNFERTFDSNHNSNHNFTPLAETKQIVQELNGEYNGSCANKPATLQLETYRTQQETESLNHSFGQYDIRGRISKNKTDNFRDSIFQKGAYNFYAGELLLYGFRENLSCRVDSLKLNCGECKFQKTSDSHELFPKEIDKPPFFDNEIKVDSEDFIAFENDPTEEELSGKYFGYLFHESQNYYQPMRMDVAAFKSRERMGSPNVLQISVISNLFFGDFTSAERISTKFDKRPYRVSNGAMMLNGDSEAFVIVREWKKDYLSVDWYSKNYARVGSAILIKGAPPEIPKSVKLIEQVSGKYLNSKFSILMTAGPEGTSDDQPFNPYHPLSIFGYLQLNNRGPYYYIQKGAFDFYSGYIWIEADKEARFLGKVKNNGMALYYTGQEEIVAVPLLKHNFTEYKKVKP